MTMLLLPSVFIFDGITDMVEYTLIHFPFSFFSICPLLPLVFLYITWIFSNVMFQFLQYFEYVFESFPLWLIQYIF